MTQTIMYKLPSLVGTKDFNPSGLQIQCLCGVIKDLTLNIQPNPLKILTALGRADTNWYIWIKKEGFFPWWNGAIDEYFKGQGLREVHQAIHRRAKVDSDQAAKLYLERFDEQYRPATDTTHHVEGIRPPDGGTGAAIERSKARAEAMTSQAKEISSQVLDSKEVKDDEGIEATGQTPTPPFEDV